MSCNPADRRDCRGDRANRILVRRLVDGIAGAMGEVIARLTGVTHRFGDVCALDAIDLEVRKGEVLAVLGPNGAGKTTAISILLGTLAVQDGQAEVFGAAPGSQSVRIRRGAMLQTSGVPEVLTVVEHLTLFRSYYPRAVPVDRLLRMAGIEDLADRRFGPGTVSRNRQAFPGDAGLSRPAGGAFRAEPRQSLSRWPIHHGVSF